MGKVLMSGIVPQLSVPSALPPIGTALNDCTWEEIDKIASAGMAESYFAVGDAKAVTVSGTVGTVAINDTYYVYILGFAHNGTENAIDFGTFKLTKDSTSSICLDDSRYGNTSSSSYYFVMNAGEINTGGWSNCSMRKVVLGSDSAPTNPTANTLLAALPSDLRAVMKPMTIYTDNAGGSNTASNVTATVDYLPLLAEFEIFGTRSYANSAEKNYQAQYAYYSAGNSKVKYRHSATDVIAFWWERSPGYTYSGRFCNVNAAGNASYTSAYYSYGLAPIFRVGGAIPDTPGEPEEPVVLMTASLTAQSGVTYTDGIADLDAATISEMSAAISNCSDITNATTTVYVDSDTLHRKITVGNQVTIALSETNYAFDVIGFNHDNLTTLTAYGEETRTGKAGMTLQMHDLFASGYSMAYDDINTGGWEGSAMRVETLGVLFPRLIPSDWQSIIKPVNKTTGIGSGSNSGTETVSDSLFLLSEVEIIGSANVFNSVNGEGTQYAYYKAGNSKKKMMSIMNANWWTRSPKAGSSSDFCYISSTGVEGYIRAGGNLGVSFAFGV